MSWNQSGEPLDTNVEFGDEKTRANIQYVGRLLFDEQRPRMRVEIAAAKQITRDFPKTDKAHSKTTQSITFIIRNN
jgi:hypothetical protein